MDKQMTSLSIAGIGIVACMILMNTVNCLKKYSKLESKAWGYKNMTVSKFSI